LIKASQKLTKCRLKGDSKVFFDAIPCHWSRVRYVRGAIEITQAPAKHVREIIGESESSVYLLHFVRCRIAGIECGLDLVSQPFEG
jgi:hypothetical protein